MRLNELFFRKTASPLREGYLLIFIAILFVAPGVTNTFAQSGAKDTDASADRNLRSSARINPSTLAMELTIPLASYPGRAGNSVPVSITYSSKVWQMKLFSTTSINSGTKYRHNAIFSDRSASGWTSSMQPPRLKSAVGIYDWMGEQYTPHYQSMMAMPEIPFEYNASSMSIGPRCRMVYEEWRAGLPRFRTTCTPDYLVLFNYSMGPYQTDLNHAPRLMIKRFYVTMPDGSSVEFRKDDNYYQLCDSQNPQPSGCLTNFSQTAEGPYLAVNGSGMRLEIGELQADQVKRNVLYMPNGGKYLFSAASVPGIPAEKFIDVNGNETLYRLDQNGDRHITDTLGKTIDDPLPDRWYTPLQEEGIFETNLKGIGNQNLVYSQRRIPLKLHECINSTDPNCGESALEDPSEELRYMGNRVCVDGVNAFLTPALFTGNGGEKEVCGKTRNDSGSRFDPHVLSDITFPDGSKYKFKYNIYGEITRIDYPTGGYERFRYAEIPSLGYSSADDVYTQTNRGVVERWVSSDGASVDQHWTYEAVSAAYPSTDYFVKTHAPDGSYTERHLYRSEDPYFGFSNVLSGMPFDERAYDTNGVLRSRTLTEWTTKASGNPNIQAAARDPRVKRSLSITFDPSPTSSIALATLSETDYDENGSSDATYFSHLNPIRKKGYHYIVLNKSSVDTQSLSWSSIPGWFTGKLAAVSETYYSYNADYRARNIIGLPTETRALNPTNPSDVLAKSQPVYDEGGVYFIDEGSTAGYEAPTGTNAHLRANVTTRRTWVKESDTWLQTHTAYDNFGNVRKIWDAAGDSDPTKFVETKYEHTVEKPYFFAYPTKVVIPPPDTGGTYGTDQTSTAETTYDPTTGLVLSGKNDFGQESTTEYDSLMRPKRVNPVVVSGVATGPATETDYGAADLSTGQYPVTERFVKTRKQIDANNWDESTTWFDGLGRTVKTVAKDSQGDVIVETTYDLMGRPYLVTNPYRAGDTVLWNKTRYDEVGRPVETFAPASYSNVTTNTNLISLGTTSFGFSTTGKVGTTVTTSDASGRKGRSITNALGQLIRVDEPTAIGGAVDADLGSISSPVQPTYYTYDLYGNMVKVEQGGTSGQKRYFKYDSLGRLIRVRQPEQEVNPNLQTSGNPDNDNWTAGFTYDAVGNVLTATDAKGVTISNTYDRAGRVTSRGYFNETGSATPPVYFFYDGKGLDSGQTPNYAKGQLTKVTNTVSETRYKVFDNFGRLKEMEQRTPANDTETVSTATPRVSKYTYNFSGALIEEEYPSGRKVQNEYEPDGDLKRVYGRASSSAPEQTYVNSFSYTASGGISRMRLGNGRWETSQFNNRNQVTQLGLGTSATDASLWKTDYQYGELNTDGSVNTSKNTGNIAKQTLTIPGTTLNQGYQYDALYRLTSAKEWTGSNISNPNWTQTFGYDVYGNRTSFAQNIGGVRTTTTPAVDRSTNRFTSTNFTYDKNGTITSDIDPVTSQARTFVFNGDNKQVEVKNGNNAAIGKYYYDGEGKRVKKVTQTETTIFVYSGGKLAEEYSTKISSSPTIAYTSTDHLGSPRVITDKYGAVKSRRDFMPFGEDIYVGVGGRTGDTGQKYASTQDEIRQKFTGYQKDSETSLDFAEARMYENRFGRFNAVDPFLASGKSSNPQTFNRYVYVGNSPLTITDPEGLDWFQKNVDGKTTYNWSNDNKVFGDGASVEGWDAVNFNGLDSLYYDGCVDAGCSGTKTALLWKSGGWAWSVVNDNFFSSGCANDYHCAGLRDPIKDAANNKAMADFASGFPKGLENRAKGLLDFPTWNLAPPGVNVFVNDSLNTRFGVKPWFNYREIKHEEGVGAAAGALTFDLLTVLATKKLGGLSGKPAPASLPEPIPVHGNSLSSMRPTWGYRLFRQDGMFLKNGITSQPIAEARYTKTFMFDKFMTVKPFPNRLAARIWEFEQNTTNPGPLNIRR
jgi:RHS repeat-associated protein